ncbi:hypothetical protein G6F48_013314 [Rhizopus delemar]|nr:hypothetical protein G6F48_013314 [Rhizopus delemar]
MLACFSQVSFTRAGIADQGPLVSLLTTVFEDATGDQGDEEPFIFISDDDSDSESDENDTSAPTSTKSASRITKSTSAAVESSTTTPKTVLTFPKPSKPVSIAFKSAATSVKSSFGPMPVDKASDIKEGPKKISKRVMTIKTTVKNIWKPVYLEPLYDLVHTTNLLVTHKFAFTKYIYLQVFCQI